MKDDVEIHKVAIFTEHDLKVFSRIYKRVEYVAEEIAGCYPDDLDIEDDEVQVFWEQSSSSCGCCSGEKENARFSLDICIGTLEETNQKIVTYKEEQKQEAERKEIERIRLIEEHHQKYLQKKKDTELELFHKLKAKFEPA